MHLVPFRNLEAGRRFVDPRTGRLCRKLAVECKEVDPIDPKKEGLDNLVLRSEPYNAIVEELGCPIHISPNRDVQALA